MAKGMQIMEGMRVEEIRNMGNGDSSKRSIEVKKALEGVGDGVL